jgi:hypothetical protein
MVYTGLCGASPPGFPLGLYCFVIRNRGFPVVYHTCTRYCGDVLPDCSRSFLVLRKPTPGHLFVMAASPLEQFNLLAIRVSFRGSWD